MLSIFFRKRLCSCKTKETSMERAVPFKRIQPSTKRSASSSPSPHWSFDTNRKGATSHLNEIGGNSIENGYQHDRVRSAKGGDTNIPFKRCMWPRHPKHPWVWRRSMHLSLLHPLPQWQRVLSKKTWNHCASCRSISCMRFIVLLLFSRHRFIVSSKRIRKLAKPKTKIPERRIERGRLQRAVQSPWKRAFHFHSSQLHVEAYWRSTWTSQPGQPFRRETPWNTECQNHWIWCLKLGPVAAWCWWVLGSVTLDLALRLQSQTGKTSGFTRHLRWNWKCERQGEVESLAGCDAFPFSHLLICAAK